MNLGNYLQALGDLLGSSSQNATASRIFISYRHEDARGDAGRLTDDLKEQLGDNQIFRDIEAIEPGVDFVEAINRALSSCAVLLAIIGPTWLTARDKEGRRRLDDPNDFIRLEIGVALKRGVRVIPVLVGDATIPRPEDLPADLEMLARRQAYELSDKRWEFDVGQLVSTLEKVPGIVKGKEKGKSGGGQKTSGGFWTRKRLAWTFGALVIGVVSGIVSEYEDSTSPVGPFPVPSPIVTQGSFPPVTQANPSPNIPPTSFVPNSPPQQTTRRSLSYTGFDAIGRYPTVVQVYNPGCPPCQELRRVVDALRPEFNDRVAFVVADLTTYEGQDFSARFGLPETTLVFFDAVGRQLGTLQGVQNQAALRNQIQEAFGLPVGAYSRR